MFLQYRDIFGSLLLFRYFDLSNIINIVFIFKFSAQPEVQFFAVDLGNMVVAFLFTDDVDPSTCDVTQITFLGDPGGVTTYTPTGGSCILMQGSLAVILLPADWQEINSNSNLMTDDSNTFVTMTSNFVEGISGANMPITNPRPVDQFIGLPGGDPPELNSVVLDLNSGTLNIQFSVEIDSLNVSMITIGNSMSSYKLTTGAQEAISDDEVLVTLLNVDLTALKILIQSSINGSEWDVNFPTNAALTSLGLGNNETTLELLAIIPDNTAPLLQTFTLDTNTGIMTVTFDEPMSSVNTLSFASITNSSTLPLSVNYTLTDSVANISDTLISFVIELTDSVLLNLQVDENVAKSFSNTYLYLSPTSFFDIGGSTLIAANPSMVSEFVSDTTAPTLESFDVSIDFGVLTLTFSEPMSKESIDVNGIFLIDSGLASPLGLTSEESVEFSDFNRIATVTLTPDTLNELKLLLFNAGSTDLFLFLMSSSITDTSGNLVIEILPSMPLQASSVFPDTMHPSLLFFSPVQSPPQIYSVNFTFSEYVDKNVFDASALTIILGSEAFGTVTFNTFSNGTVTQMGFDMLNYEFSSSDLDGQFSIFYQISYYSGNISLTFAPQLITDLAGLILQSPANPIVHQATEIDDTGDPYLQVFSLDLVTGTMRMNFSENVLIISSADSLILVNSVPTPSFSLVLSQSSYSDLELMTGDSFTITLDSGDLSELLAEDTIATDISNTYLLVLPQFAVDYSGNYLNNTVQIQVDEVLVPVVIPSSTPVEVEPSSTILMSVSSSVVLTTSTSESAISSSVTLTVPPSPSPLISTTSTSVFSPSISPIISMTSMSVAPSVVSTISTSVALSSSPTISTSVAPSSVSSSASMMSSETVISSATISTSFSSSQVIMSSIIPTSSLVIIPSPSPIPPLLINETHLDMDTGILTILFSRDILIDSVSIEGNFVFTNVTLEYVLTVNEDINFVNPDNNNAIDITINLLDLVNLKAIQISSSWSLSVASNAVTDTNDNAIQEQTVLINTFIPDTSLPQLLTSQLDMDKGQLILTFNDPILEQSVNVSNIYITSLLANSPSGYGLASSTVMFSEYNSFTVTITNSTLNLIKADTNIATELADSFIFIAAVNLEDYNNNVIVSPGIIARPVNNYVSDITEPLLISYQLDLNLGTMTITFNEPIDSIDTTNAFITKDPPFEPISSSASILGTVNGSSESNTVVSLSISSIEDIKLTLYGGTNAYLSIPSTFASDTSGNSIISLVEDDRKAASNIIPDTVSPQVNEFIPLASTPEEVSITFIFNENMILNSMDETSMDISTDNMTYSGFSGGIWSASTNDTINYQFSQADTQQSLFGAKYLIATNAGEILAIFGSNFATDLSANVVEVPNLPLSYTTVKQDNTPPTLQSFDLDTDSGYFVVRFSEPVILLSITEGLQFQNASMDPSHTHSLNSSSYTDQIGLYGNSITIVLEQEDLSALVNNTNFASTTDDTYILPTTQLAVDYSGNELSVSGGAVQAVSVITPLTAENPAVVEGATMDFDSGLLVLSFDISINPAATVTSEISFTNGDTNYSIGSSSDISNIDEESVIGIQLVQSDLNAIKFIIINSNTLWNISLGMNAIVNTDNVGNFPQTIQITNMIHDTTAPNVTSYSLDMDSGIVAIAFNEPVSNSTFNTSSIWLSGSANTEPTGYQLSNSQLLTTSTYNTILEFQIQEAIINMIKVDATVATMTSNSYIFFTFNGFQDISDNNLLSSQQSFQPALYVSDTTSPSLITFNLDIDNGVLSLTFDEPVDAASFNPESVKIFNSDESDSVTILNYSVQSNGYSTDVISMITSNTLNDIKLLISSSGVIQAYLSMPSSSITDVAGNVAVEVSELDPLRASDVVADTTAPTLVSMTAGNENERTISLTFNEYIQPSSWNGAGLMLLLNSTIGSNTYTEFTDGTVSSAISTSVIYTISNTKFQPLLSIHYQQAYYSGSIGITFGSNLITDLNGNAVNSLATPVYYNSMQTDPVRPELVEFELDLDSSILIITFSENVLVNTIPGNVRIQNSASSPSQLFTLTSSSYSSQEGSNGLAITITLFSSDVIALATNDQMATSIDDTYLVLNSGFAVDYSGNYLSSQTDGVQASSFAELTGPINPQVTSFDLDLDSDQLTLHFDTAVDVSTLKPSGIVLVNESTVSDSTFKISLSNVTVIAQGQQTDFRILLNNNDIVNVKRNPLCYTADNCYAIFEEGLVISSDNLPSQGITNPIQVSTILEDVTPPRFLSFPVFDLNSGYFTIIFSEPVNGSSTDYTEIKFANSESNPSQVVMLTEGYTSPDHVEIDFNLHKNDLNAIKYILDLCTEVSNCWLNLPSFIIADIGSNPFLHSNYKPGADASFHQPSVFIPDSTPPKLESVSIDMDIGQLVLSFDEVINEGDFTPSDVTLLNSQSGEISLVLSNQTTFSRTSQGTAIELIMSVDDLNWLKARNTFTSETDSHLSLSTDMADVSDNVFVNIPTESAMQISIFTPDTTEPQLVSFDLFNIDNGSFFISFDEPMDASTLNTSFITLVSGTVGDVTSYQLTDGSATPVNEDKLTFMIQLAQSDRVAIKLLPELATSDGNTFIALGTSALLDTAQNSNIEISLSSAMKVTNGGYVADTSPSILSSAELDLNSGEIKLVFDDVINAATFAPTLLTIQNQSSIADGTSYKLTSSSQESQSSDVIQINLDITDLNNIKADLFLATKVDNSYISFPSNIAQDIEGRSVISVPDTEGHMVSVYIMDTTSPNLVSYNLDMNTGLVIMTFDEAILLTSFTPAGITFQNNISSPTTSYQLQGGELIPDTANAVTDSLVTLMFSNNDLNEIKSRTTLATGVSDSHLSVSSSFITDTASNIILSSIIQPNEYLKDVTLPKLAQANLDLRSNAKMILVFSEAIRFTESLNDKVQLQNQLNNPTEVIALDSSGTAAKTALDEITITFSSEQTTKLLSDDNIASRTSNAFVYLSSGAIYDYSEGAGQTVDDVTKQISNLCKLLLLYVLIT